MRYAALASLLVACASDPAPVSPDAAAPVDVLQPVDVAVADDAPVDTGRDAQVLEAGVDASAVADAPLEVSTEAAVDAPSDAAAEASAPSDAATGPIECRDRPPRCASNNDCAMCIRATATGAWCCRAAGFCAQITDERCP